MKKESTVEKISGLIFCFVIAGLIYNYVDSGMWRNIGIGFLVLIGFVALYEIFDKGKSKSYDTSKIQRFDTSKNKFADLAGELEKKKGSIENMYKISVDEINKNVFSDDLICKISNEGLFTFKCIFNVFLYAKLSTDDAIPNFDGDKDIANIQKIITGIAMHSSKTSKPFISQKKAKEIWVKKKLLMSPLKAIALSKKNNDNSAANKLLVDSFLLSLNGHKKNMKLKKVYDYCQQNTDEIIERLDI
jgi:hypothetical protein|tara:strand:- start:25 stop:762 length:738 start_codon:yes stop_codon:yes gene_type:complete